MSHYTFDDTDDIPCDRCKLRIVNKHAAESALSLVGVWRVLCQEMEDNEIPIPYTFEPSFNITKRMCLEQKDDYVLCCGCTGFLERGLKYFHKITEEFYDSNSLIKEPAE